MPYPPLGVLNIPLVAGNDVNMDMKNTLPGRRAYIDADIVAIRAELLIQQLALLGYQRHTGIDLLRRQVEKTGHMPLRDDQGMPRAHRVGITRAERKFTIQGHPLWVCTKQTRVVGVPLFFLFIFRRQPSIPYIKLA